MDHLTLEFEINAPGDFPQVHAQVILDGWCESLIHKMPAITRECDTFNELDAELKWMERQIEKVRQQALKKFEGHRMSPETSRIPQQEFS
jgi:hypothetical protein